MNRHPRNGFLLWDRYEEMPIAPVNPWEGFRTTPTLSAFPDIRGRAILTPFPSRVRRERDWTIDSHTQEEKDGKRVQGSH